MPDDLYDDIDDDDEDEPVEETSQIAKIRRRNREQAKELKALRERLEKTEAADRDLAFLRAGIDLDDPKTYYFRKGVDPEILKDPVALKAEAMKAGILAEAPSDPNLEGHQAANAAAEGAEGVQPSENREAEYEAEMAQAQSRDEILAVMRKYDSPIAEEVI